MANRATEAPSAKDVILGLARRCMVNVLKGSPPQPCEEVTELLRSLRISKKHLQDIYYVFHSLREIEVDGAEIVTDATEIDRETLKHIIPERRKWVMKLLMRLLQLGQVDDQITWDGFLYIFINFCSLNRMELAQTLFLVIVKETGKTVQHYITALDLQQFFWFWREAPVKSFNTKAIDFDLLPLTRYYVSDFTELTQRFPCLINPFLHLQQTLQEQLPSYDFWDNVDRTAAFCRKINMEFFSMEENRVHLYGEPPFRETCDMLVPDALGAVPINKRQWIMRTAGLNYGYGLRQSGVWGEQVPPETIDVMELAYEKYLQQKAYEEKLAAHAAAHGIPMVPSTMGAAAAAGTVPTTTGPPAAGAPAAGAWPAGGGAPTPGTTDQQQKDGTAADPSAQSAAAVQAKKDEFEAEMPEWQPVQAQVQNLTAAPTLAPGLDPTMLSIRAAAAMEKDAHPTSLLPPVWMKACTIAPPPKLHRDDKPLPNFCFGGTPLDPPPEDRMPSTLLSQS